MGKLLSFASVAGFAAVAAAQVATWSNNGESIAVNIPSDTASSGSGPIYFQISAPSGTEWIAFGQGSRMSGSNMFVVYAKDSTNVTLSSRLGTGHSMPQYDSSAQVTLLEGSGIGSDGSLVANVRCDNCDSWNGGSMSFTDSSSSWIHASKSGDALNTDDVSASISQHDSDTTLSIDLTSGTGGSSTNPFFTSSGSSTESASASGSTATATQATATPSSTNGVSAPVASSGSSSSSGSSASSGSYSDIPTLMNAHGIIMSILFVGLFPLFALTLYLPTTKKVRYIHAPLQILATILLIVGMALGIVLGKKIDELDGYHMVIGFIVVAGMVVFQPAMGLYQHLYYHKTGGRSIFGVLHRWLGRSLMILGIINGGLGWMISGSTEAYVPYAVIAALIFLVYIAVLFFAWYRGGDTKSVEGEKAASERAYEMQNGRGPRHQRLTSEGPNAYQEQSQRANRNSTGYTIQSRS